MANLDSPELLPQLRPELGLFESASSVGGEPQWVLHDPMRHRYFHLDGATRELLSVWTAAKNAGELAAAVQSRFHRTVSQSEIARLVRFLYDQQLTTSPRQGDWRTYARIAVMARPGALGKIAHDYLFFRVPLFSPQLFLVRTLPLVACFYTRFFLISTVICGLLGVYFISQRWELFVRQLQDCVHWSGFATFAAVLLAVKLAHELAHAYTAVRLGCQVSTMGVAFMMLAPMPYTDVSDAWRLRDRRNRRSIDSAGIKIELAIAAYASLLWVFLPDGAPRYLVAILAALTWTTSVMVNLNPLVRFDGYYLLSDSLGIDNLQGRAFAIGRWRLRELLFGLGKLPPEVLSRGRIAMLTLYAYAVWVYRLTVSLAIAFAVFHFAFKLLGLLLFSVEVVLLILRPLWLEIKVWTAMRNEIATAGRWRFTAGLAGGLGLLLVMPLSTSVVVPGLLEFAELAPVHASVPARVSAVHVAPGQKVSAGDALVTLSSDDLKQRLRLAETKLAALTARLDRRASDVEDRSSSIVLEKQFSALKGEIAGLRASMAELAVKAKSDGKVLEIEPNLVPDRWVNVDDPLMLIAAGERYEAHGYVGVDDVERISTGTRGWFIPDDVRYGPWPVMVVRVGASAANAIDVLPLASVYEGPIAVEPDPQGRLVPSAAQVRLSIDVDPMMAPPTVVKGIVHLSGRPESVAARIMRQVAKVLAREGGA